MDRNHICFHADCHGRCMVWQLQRYSTINFFIAFPDMFRSRYLIYFAAAAELWKINRIFISTLDLRNVPHTRRCSHDDTIIK